ncbi:hypothetical protein C900_03456 [Fulvivirga imtechensis AK7]|uniref:Uncharacterized protein n=1 Tax=Fulvivirga imtechensis AK7 TaxID=1237149 RepID=L8JR62_9BACT|nr:hypothetical protein [Fulvivirga imtechensis]ELR70683.1 hypothetical protein C900_03456 [Fulvivirga imtechensis AK7]
MRNKEKKAKKEKELIKKVKPDEEANEKDYGGLPERNLKKNLGCGG